MRVKPEKPDGRRGARPALPLRRRLLFAAIVLLAAAAVAAAGGEVALRVSYDGVAQITGVAEWRPGRAGEHVYHWDAYHPVLGWTNLAGYESPAGAPYAVEINSQGLRAARDYAPEPPAGTRRVAVFGDSCTFGEEVDDDVTMPRFLERHLAGCEVLNFGVHGYGFGQMVLRLELDGARFSPDHVVIVVMIPEDVFRDGDATFLHPKPVFVLQGGELAVENTPAPVAAALPWLVRNSYAAAWLFGRPRGASGDPTARLDVADALAARARRFCAEIDARLSLVLIAGPGRLQHVMRDPAQRAALEDMRARFRELPGVDVLDLCEPLERLLAELEADAVAGDHWSARANCELAAWIADHLAVAAGAELAASRPDCRALDSRRLDAARALAVARPDDAEARYGFATELNRAGRRAEAIAELEAALELRPAWPTAQNQLAWLLATSDEPGVRDPARAIVLATAAVESTRRQAAPLLATLAAAHAAAGDFGAAEAVAREAIARAEQRGDLRVAELVRSHLESYRARRPVGAAR